MNTPSKLIAQEQLRHLGLALAALTSMILSGPAHGQKEDHAQWNKAREVTLGGRGGNQASVSLHTINKLQVRGGEHVDAVVVNDELLGTNGGRASEETLLFNDQHDRYISEVYVRWGDWMDYIEFTTNDGRTISAGNKNGGSYEKRLKGIRLVSIGGKWGQYMDSVTLHYIDNYTGLAGGNSTVAEAAVVFIVAIQQGPASIEEGQTLRQRKMSTHTRVLQSMTSMGVRVQGGQATFLTPREGWRWPA